MSEFSPIPPEDAPATGNTGEAASGEPSPAPAAQKTGGGFSARAKRIIALLFVSNILFGVSALLVWRSGSTRAATLTAALAAARAEAQAQDPDQDREAPVRAADVEGNFTDEMKIPQTAYLDEPPRDERIFDHPGSPYFYNYDFYNAESTDTLTILPHFRTIQQVKNNSCGIASILMVMDYFGKMGDWNEATLKELVPQHLEEDGEPLHYGYCLEQLIDVFNQVGGFELETTYDHQSDNYWDVVPRLFRGFVEEGVPVIVGSAQRGGHWMVVIGYDDMGTSLAYDDVFILADSGDYYDHNADGYTVINAEDYFNTFHFYTLWDLEDHQSDYCFIAARPIE